MCEKNKLSRNKENKSVPLWLNYAFHLSHAAIMYDID